MVITIIQTKADGSKSYRRVKPEELVKELTGEKFQSAISKFRENYPLIQREFGEQKEALISYELRDIPYVSFSTEYVKKQTERQIVAYNPLVLLTVSNLRNEELAEQLRNKASQLPYSRLVFLTAEGRGVNIVCEVRPFGEDMPTDEQGMRRMLNVSSKQLSKIYSDHLHVSIDACDDAMEAESRMSYDAKAFYNEISTVYQVNMNASFMNADAGMANNLPLQVKDEEDREKWRRIYIDNLRRAQSEAFNADDPMFETLLALARYCHETSMPQGLAEGFAMHYGEFRQHATLVSDTFTAEYEKELRNAHPEKVFNKNAMLMMRTTQFLNTHYRLRRNILNGKLEYRLNDGSDFDYHLLSDEVMNTMTIKALSSGIDSWDRDIKRYIHSNYLPVYDPVNDWLDTLPKWDGKDRVTELARRIPTDNVNWERNFHVWMLSMVAQWMGRDDQHGNAIAPILIGGQGTGKTSFCRIILPETLYEYYNDGIDFKDDKGVYHALSRYALINIDEFDSLTKRQQPVIKFILSKSDVKYRAAYKSYIEQHKRYASFIGTTNNMHPLSDPTGSRRFICVHVTGAIDHETPVEYDQLYAQLREEVIRGDRYWFTAEEGEQITMQNKRFQKEVDLSVVIASVFRKPIGDEDVELVSLEDVAKAINERCPEFDLAGNYAMKVGRHMKMLKFNQVREKGIRKYEVARI